MRRTRYAVYRDDTGHRVHTGSKKPAGAVKVEGFNYYVLKFKCKECHKEGPKTTSRQEYCSDACRADAWRRRKARIPDSSSEVQHGENRESDRPAGETT